MIYHYDAVPSKPVENDSAGPAVDYTSSDRARIFILPRVSVRRDNNLPGPV